MLSKNDLEILKNDTAINNLMELTDIHINPNELLENRINTFFEGIGNPYCFKINGTVFRIKFSDNDKSLDNGMYNYLSNIIELED